MRNLNSNSMKDALIQKIYRLCDEEQELAQGSNIGYSPEDIESAINVLRYRIDKYTLELESL